jgi:5'-nucleotidase
MSGAMAIRRAGVLVAASAQERSAGAQRLRVLVTNDDGVKAPGIDALVDALRRRGDLRVTVVAPATQQSGTGGATTKGRLTAWRTTTRGGVRAIGVRGYPADSVRYALDTVMRDHPPDVVIAGVNEGANLGPVIEVSGTVGAARAAARRGLPALATSMGRGEPTRFAGGVRQTLRWLDANRDHLHHGTVTNLNTPGCRAGRVRGTLEVPPARRYPGGRQTVDCRQAATGQSTDVAAFFAGFAAIGRIPVAPGSGRP